MQNGVWTQVTNKRRLRKGLYGARYPVPAQMSPNRLVAHKWLHK